MAWTLTLNATTYATTDNVVRDLTLLLVSLAPDTLTFAFRAAIDASLPFAVGEAAILTDTATVRFRGRIDSIEPAGEGLSEEIIVTCVGPWSYLERIVYEQTYQVGNGTNATLISQSKTRIIIGQDDSGAKRSIGAEITAAVAYAVAAGATITLATVSISTTVHYQELLDVTCAEAIRSMLRYLPDTMSWCDYSTNPPTLTIARRSALSSTSINLTGGTVENFAVRSRPDLVARGVQLFFESSYTYNDSTYPQVATQSAGTTTGERVVKATIPLEGSGVTVQEQKIRVRAVSESSETFWREVLSVLSGVSTSDFSISDGSFEEQDPSDDSWATRTLANFLLEGSMSPWMNVDTLKGRGSVKVTYTGSNAVLKEKLGDNVARWHNVSGYLTDATSKTYRRITSSWAGESAPSGMASAMYAAMSVLHYEGQLTLADGECSFTPRPALLLNLTNGRSEWTTMAAAIQTVTHRIQSGTTTASFGPAQQLSPQAFVEMLRGNRATRTTWRVNERIGENSSASIDHGGEIQPFNDSSASPQGETVELEFCHPTLGNCTGKFQIAEITEI